MNAARSALLVLALGQAGWAQATSEAPLEYARITAKEVQPRCFASAKSPVYPERLGEGQIVRVGAATGDYRRIWLPLGIRGYVHKKFAEGPVEGMVKTAGTNVAFRYRPVASEIPAQMLPQGTPLHYLGEEGDWWVVSNSTAEAYLAAADLQTLAMAEPVEAGWQVLETSQRQRWSDAVQAREQVLAEAAKVTAARTKLDDLTKRVHGAASSTEGRAALAPLLQEATEFAAGLTAGSTERQAADALVERVRQAQLIVEAERLVQQEPPTVDEAVRIVPPEPVDPLARFDGVGWLRHRTALGGQQTFALEKGGRLLYEVTCATGRYDLRWYDNLEVGLIGTRSQASAEQPRQLDVLKLEVLRLPRE